MAPGCPPVMQTLKLIRLHLARRSGLWVDRLLQPAHRWYSDAAAAAARAAKTESRMDRIIARCPRFTRPHLTALRHQPISVLTSFLLIHEITAVVPLFGLAGLFHYYRWLPPFFAEGEWILKIVSSMGKMLRRWGWVDAAEEKQAEKEAEVGIDGQQVEQGKVGSVKTGKGQKETPEKVGIMKRIGKWWTRGEDGTRVVIEFATAYAIVKVLLIPRLMFSAALAPWFATRLLLPAGRFTRNLVVRKKRAP